MNLQHSRLGICLLLIFFIAPFVVFGQEKEKTPTSTVSHIVHQAPQRFDKVDKDKNKISDGLDGLVRPAGPKESFDVIILLNSSLDVLPTLKGRHGNFSKKFTYSSINGFAATLTKEQITAFSQDADVKFVEYDAPVYPLLDTAQQWFGTTKAKTDFGVNGDSGDGAKTYSKNDIVIAILDTGIDPNHADLGPSKIIGWRDATINNDQSGPYDELGDCGGHGTHVSSIAAGEGDGNAAYKGVAPGAALVGIKVLSNRIVPGEGTICTAATSEIISGVQWMIDNKATYGIEVGNMSLGAAGCSDGTDSLSLIVNSAVNSGIVMVVAAGNEGPGVCSMGSPGAAEKAITVGAMADVTAGSNSATFPCGGVPYKGFHLACFSSRGPTYDFRIKPDIVSPGVFINAAKAGTTNGYIEKSGTSVSSPFTAGLVGLMLDANLGLTPFQIKSTIESTASDWGIAGKDIDYGSGRLQAHEAIESVVATPGSNVPVPTHTFVTGSLSGTGSSNIHTLNITDASLPIAATLIIATSGVDFDLEILDSSNNPLFSCTPSYQPTCTCINDTNGICKSQGVKDQETVGFQPQASDTYKLRVVSFSGSGSYFIDTSFGQPAVSISLNTDGSHNFGAVALGNSSDNISSFEQIVATTGPADISVRSSNFSDGMNIWQLGITNEGDQILWEFSKDASTWKVFSIPNSLFTFDTDVAQGATRDLYLKLTMPTETSSNNEHSATVTIVATAP